MKKMDLVVVVCQIGGMSSNAIGVSELHLHPGRSQGARQLQHSLARIQAFSFDGNDHQVFGRNGGPVGGGAGAAADGRCRA